APRRATARTTEARARADPAGALSMVGTLGRGRCHGGLTAAAEPSPCVTDPEQGRGLSVGDIRTHDVHMVSILLVDDEAAITDNLAPFLRRAGFAVTVAADGDSAL